MKNLFISNLNEKNVDHCTTDFGLWLRRVSDRPFKKLCNIFTNAYIIKENSGKGETDEEYFLNLNLDYIPVEEYDIKEGKNNIIVERYPELNPDESYIFVCNHTCPEDIETVLNILDRNAYLVLGSIESLQYNPEMYLSFMNGMLPFDIMDSKQRKEVYQKMLRVLKTNSILIFPEGSHNYSPNNLINPLFDGPINLALQTKKKIVVLTMLKDQEKNVSYIDVSNPIDVEKINIDMTNIETDNNIEIEKYYVKSLSSCLRDRMATSVYYMISRHFKSVIRNEYTDIEEDLRMKKIVDAFSKLKWDRDVFEAEYLVKKTKEEVEYEEVVASISNLVLNSSIFNENRKSDWVLKKEDIDHKNVVNRMRDYWLSTVEAEPKSKVLKKTKF